MKIFIIILSFFCFSSCEAFIMDQDWTQHFMNNSDKSKYFYLHYYKDGKVKYPAYDELTTRPNLVLIAAHTEGWWSMWPTKFKWGTLGHMYAFDPDTLDRYSWEEVLAKKKYWFTARPCRTDAIQFPEEFEYMGDI